MLGLGSSLTTGGVSSLPPISSIGTHTIYFVKSGQPDDGTLTDFTSPTVTDCDIRIFAGNTNFVSPVSDYTVTSITVKNNTTSSAAVELVTSPLSLDSQSSALGGVLVFVFDDDSVMDDFAFGSSSSHAFKHNGNGSTNSFTFTLKFTHAQFDGENTLSSTSLLSDSDA